MAIIKRYELVKGVNNIKEIIINNDVFFFNL